MTREKKKKNGAAYIARKFEKRFDRDKQTRSKKQRGKIPSKLKALLATLNFMSARTTDLFCLSTGSPPKQESLCTPKA